MAAENVLKQRLGADEVVVPISGAEEPSEMKKQTKFLELSAPSSSGMGRLSPLRSDTPKPTFVTGLRRRPLCPKPKSRLLEPPYPRQAKVVGEGNAQNQTATARASSPYRYESSPTMNSSYNGGRGVATEESKRTKMPSSATPETPLMASIDEEEEEEDDDDVYMAASYPEDQVELKKRSKHVKFLVLMEWIALFSILVVLISSLCINKLKDHYIWGLNIWKWCLLVLVVVCGHLFTEWFTDVVAFFIEINFLHKKKVLYFIYGLRRSVRVFIWLGLILLTWVLLIDRGVKRSRKTTRVLDYITRAIACSFVSVFLWMLKTLFVKLLASSFHVKAFFERIQESVFHQYVLKVLSGPPLLKYGGSSINEGRLSIQQKKKLGKQKGSEEEVIDVDKLYKMKKEKISGWTIGGLVKVIRSSGLSTLSGLLGESQDNEGVEQKEIKSEFEAKTAAEQIFRKVAKTAEEYIEEQDLLHFMPPQHVERVLLMFEEAAETGKIKKEEFNSWVVKVYNERKYLAHSLDDSNTAIEELNKISSVVLLLIIIILWLLLMRIATTHVLVFISSQLLLVVFMFGNSAKMLFEALIFIFVTHPFDVGDKCVIDGEKMTVEEMNVLTTTFLRSDNEKLYYPNAVLSSKPIANVNRSPEMGDSVEFAIDFSTSVKTIAAFKARIKEYLESKPTLWRPDHTVAINAVEDMTKLNMNLSVTHTINFQQGTEITNRKSELVLELKRIFEDLDIKYHLLPQEVHLRYVGSETQTSTAATATH